MALRDNSVQGWMTILDDGLEYRKKYGMEESWARNEALFYHATEDQIGNVGPNIIASTGDSLMSSLLVPRPYMMIEALQQKSLVTAPIVEALMKQLFGSMKIKPEVMAIALHAYLYGVGVLKIGYDSEWGFCPGEDIALKKGSPAVGITLSQFDKKGSKIEFDSRIRPGMPWCEAVLPHDFVVPYGAKASLKKSPWAMHRIIRHIDDLRADPKYTNKGGLEPTMSMQDWVKSYQRPLLAYRQGRGEWNSSRKDQGDKVEFVELWEIHDARTQRVMVMADGHDKWLRNDVDYLQMRGLPFVAMSFVMRSRCFWTTPDVYYLQAAQEEAVDIATMQKRQRRISLLRFLYMEGVISPDELEKFWSGEIGVGVAIKNNGQSLQESILAMNAFTNNNQLQNEAESLRRDARETVGFGRNQMGELSPGRHTAHEAVIADEASSERGDRRVDAMADLHVDLTEILIGIIVAFWKTPRMIQMVGEDGALVWQSYIGSQLKGDYSFECVFSKQQTLTLEQRGQKALGMFQVLSQDSGIDQLRLRRYLVRMTGDVEIAALFKPGLLAAATAGLVNGGDVNANVRLLMQGLQQQVGGSGQSPQPGGGSGPGTGASMSSVQPQQQRPTLQPGQSGGRPGVGH